MPITQANKNKFAKKLLNAKNKYNKTKNSKKALSVFRFYRNKTIFPLAAQLRLSGSPLIFLNKNSNAIAKPKGNYYNSNLNIVNRKKLMSMIANHMSYLNRNSFMHPY